MKPTSHLAGKDGHHSIITVFDAGANGTVISSRYTSRSRCPEVLINGTQARQMRREEASDDLTAALIRPAWQQ
ncbi:MAG TPA: hypothetical protein HA272_01235 [Methanoregula sp.]|nr:hypothetical protein [Methanoregula sp.]